LRIVTSIASKLRGPMILRRLRCEAPGLLLLAFALAFNAILLAPEVHIERVP